MLLTIWGRLRQVRMWGDKTGGRHDFWHHYLDCFLVLRQAKPRGYWMLREAITKVSGSCVLQSLVATGPNRFSAADQLDEAILPRIWRSPRNENGL